MFCLKVKYTNPINETPENSSLVPQKSMRVEPTTSSVYEKVCIFCIPSIKNNCIKGTKTERNLFNVQSFGETNILRESFGERGQVNACNF